MKLSSGGCGWLLLLLLCTDRMFPGSGQTPPSPSPPAAGAPSSTQRADQVTENVCELEKFADVMFCYCDVLELVEATTADCWVYGETKARPELWRTFASQTQLQQVSVTLRGDGSLRKLPTEIVRLLPRLWRLEVKGASIEKVHEDSLARSTNLGQLVLAENGIKKLARHAFHSLKNLTSIALGGNKIEMLTRHAFRDLPHMRHLNLTANCISIIQSGAFSSLTRLKVLELVDNRLGAITPHMFRGLRRLEHLDLKRNLLQTIEDRTFSALRRLRQLDLEQNRLKFISGRALAGLANLRWLNLHDNKLLQIVPDTFVQTTRLAHLDLRQNVLDTLERTAFLPIVDNLRRADMRLLLEGNNFHCDCRLAWLPPLRTDTASGHVRAALDAAVCHVTAATDAAQTSDVTANNSTLGIGPPVRLMDFQFDRLSCDASATVTPQPNSYIEVSTGDATGIHQGTSPQSVATTVARRIVPPRNTTTARSKLATNKASSRHHTIRGISGNYSGDHRSSMEPSNQRGARLDSVENEGENKSVMASESRPARSRAVRSVSVIRNMVLFVAIISYQNT